MLVLKLPIILSYPEAEKLGQLILKSASSENEIIRFQLPGNFIIYQYQPGSVISLSYRDCLYQIRLVYIKISRIMIEFYGQRIIEKQFYL